MSAYELRELVRARINEAIGGEDGEGGVMATVIAGAPKDYAVYRDMTGYIRGLRTAVKIIDDAFRDIAAGPPQENPTPGEL